MITIPRVSPVVLRALRWGVLALVLGMGGIFSPLLAEDSLASVARSYFDKAIDAAKAMISGEESGEESTEIIVDPDEVAREEALAVGKAAIFLTEGNYDFTQSRWGAKPTPYQLEGLKLVPLEESPLSAGDEAAGIDRRLTYEFLANTHRRFHEQTGWGRWTKGVPPHLDSITLVREKGVWKVASSPAWAYSLK
jgi:hypothetical protein